MEEEKNDAQILSPGVPVGGYMVKPWTFMQLFALAPTFAEMSDVLNAKQITWETFKDMADGKVGAPKVLEILGALRPFLPGIIGQTVGCTAEEVETMDFDRAISIGLVILIQNLDRIKNLSGLVQTVIASLKAGQA